jgi:hypothetical protein
MWAIFLASFTIGLIFGTQWIAKRYGTAVQTRFLEGADYTAESLRRWVSEHAHSARAYARPVLFPLDLVLVGVFGGFLIVGSHELSSSFAVPTYRFLLLVLPVLYVIADLCEDVLLALMLLSPSRITEQMVRVAKTATGIKFVTSTLSLIELLVLSALRMGKA